MSKNKNILVGVAQDGKGGLDSYIYKFVKIANKNGFHCDVLTSKYNKDFNNKLNKENSRLIKIANLHNKKAIYNKINSLSEGNNYVAAYWNISTALMFPYIKAASNNNIHPNIVQSHASSTDVNNIIKDILQKILHFWNRKRINRLDIKKAAVSKMSANWMFGKSSSFIYIEEPVDVAKYKFNIHIRNDYRKKFKFDDEFIVGCVTSFLPIKNPLYIIDVMEQLQSINPHSKLIVCGDGPLKNIFKQQANLRLVHNSFQLLGYRSDVNNILQALDAFIFPSKIEGLGMALLEAQASSLPCIYNDSLPEEVNIIPELTNVMNGFCAKEWAAKLDQLSKENNKRSANTSKILSKAGFTPNSPQKIIDLINP